MKVFGIGLNKTGTSTLGEAGRRVGLRVKTWDARLFEEAIVHRRRDRLGEIIAAHDLFEDFPWPLLYAELDRVHHGAKFILTRRVDESAWLASVNAHAMRARISSRTLGIVYGAQYPYGNEERYLAYYRDQNDRARTHFTARPQDFLEICWEEEPDLERFVRFLGREADDLSIPHVNAAQSKRANPLRVAFHYVARSLGR